MELGNSEQADDGGGEDDVEEELKDEVSANESDKDPSPSGGACTVCHFVYPIPEEEAGTDEEDARIDEGADDGGAEGSEVEVDILQELEDKTCTEAAEHTLDEDGEDGTKGIPFPSSSAALPAMWAMMKPDS